MWVRLDLWSAGAMLVNPMALIYAIEAGTSATPTPSRIVIAAEAMAWDRAHLFTNTYGEVW